MYIQGEGGRERGREGERERERASEREREREREGGREEREHPDKLEQYTIVSTTSSVTVL